VFLCATFVDGYVALRGELWFERGACPCLIGFDSDSGDNGAFGNTLYQPALGVRILDCARQHLQARED
jgi:hypothetical protein